MNLPLALFTIAVASAVNPPSDPIDKAADRHSFEWFGLTIEAAREKASERKLEFRVVKLDGEYLTEAKDYRQGRINAHVVNDKIVAIEIEGQGHSIVEGVINLRHLPYLGLREDEAIKFARQNQLPFRIIIRNGRSHPVTQDYIRNRANAKVENGVVVAVTTG